MAPLDSLEAGAHSQEKNSVDVNVYGSLVNL